MPASAESFDFVIVGAGSAGCAMAARLSEDGAHSVAVLEAGGSDRSVFIQMPSALSIPMNSPKYDWGYETEPEPHLGGRRLHCPRGKVIGGSSSINGMVYVRGNALDFDEWEAEGAAGWGYRNVLPYFKRAESRAEGGNEWRGSDGPLHTAYGTLDNPLYRAFIAAAVQAGYAETDDINGFRQEGFGRMDQTIHKGRRWSAANAYLKPALKRPNLSVHLAFPRDPDRLRGTARGRRRIQAGWPRRGGTHRPRAARGHSRGRLDRIAAPADAVRASDPARNSPSWTYRLSSTARASAGICRTTSNSTSRWRAGSRSRSIR